VFGVFSEHVPIILNFCQIEEGRLRFLQWSHRYFGKETIDLRAEQGYEIGRPSLLLLRAEGQDDNINISVGGKSIIVARGEFV
jgi:predicted PhzF superfamily epimerase YddE/YHI9